MTKSGHSSIWKNLERLILVAGLALFAGLVYRIGPGRLLQDLSLVGAGFAIVFGLEALANLFNTLAWRYAIHPMPRRVPLWDLLGMRMAGDAVNYITPSASIGGEFVKGRLLQRRIPAAEAMASVSLAKINQFLSQIIFVFLCTPFFAQKALALGTLPLTFGLGGLALSACAVLFFLARWQDPLQRLRIFLLGRGWFRHWTADAEAWRKLDESISGSYQRYPKDHGLSVVFFTLSWGIGVVEIRLILHLLLLPAGWSAAIAIEGLSILVDMVFFYVPAKIGTQEGGKYFIFLLLGLNPASGFALGLVRRLREIAWTFIGLLILACYQSVRWHGDRGDATAPGLPAVLRSEDINR